jgi:hypothetical protein
VIAGGVSGCRGTVAADKSGPKQEEDTEAVLQQFIKILTTRGNETPNYAEGLKLLSTYVKRKAEANPGFQAKMQPAPEELAVLKERWKLKDAQLGELDGLTYSSLDAAHLEFCYVLRDAAQVAQKNVPKATRRDLAVWSFDWTARQVRLQEEKREPLPPGFVLRRGQGTALERALVFLALLQQQDIDGCLVGCRDDKNELFLWAAGALVADKGKREILLFDPRLGVPIPGPAGVATLEEIRTRPQLLPTIQSDGVPAYRATPEQVAKAEVFVAPPLSALSPRMRFLEGLVADFDRVRLANDPAKLLERFGPEKAGVWGAGTANAPALLLWNFLPPDQGGVDKSGRDAWFRRKQIPWLTIRLRVPELPTLEAENPIAHVVSVLYETYDVRPRELLWRGKFDEATRRLVRIHDEYQAEREAFRDPAHVRRVQGEWPAHVKKVYLTLVTAKAAAQQEPGNERIQSELRTAKKQVEALMEDEYLGGLMSGVDEVGLMKEKAPNQKQDQPRRGLLTSVVLLATTSTLGADTAYLQALVRQERAELAQGRRQQKPDKAADATALRAWRNTQKGWETYLAEYPYTSDEAARRLYGIFRLDRQNELFPASAVSLLEEIFQDVAMQGQAQFLRARALEMAGDLAAARETLQKMPAELTALEKVLESVEKGGLQEIRRVIDSRLRLLESQEAARAGQKAEPSAFLSNLRNLSLDLSALEHGAWRDTFRDLRASASARLQQLPATKR